MVALNCGPIYLKTDKLSNECTISHSITSVCGGVLIKLKQTNHEMQRKRQCPQKTPWNCNCVHVVGINIAGWLGVVNPWSNILDCGFPLWVRDGKIAWMTYSLQDPVMELDFSVLCKEKKEFREQLTQFFDTTALCPVAVVTGQRAMVYLGKGLTSDAAYKWNIMLMIWPKYLSVEFI